MKLNILLFSSYWWCGSVSWYYKQCPLYIYSVYVHNNARHKR